MPVGPSYTFCDAELKICPALASGSDALSHSGDIFCSSLIRGIITSLVLTLDNPSPCLASANENTSANAPPAFELDFLTFDVWFISYSFYVLIVTSLVRKTPKVSSGKGSPFSAAFCNDSLTQASSVFH